MRDSSEKKKDYNESMRKSQACGWISSNKPSPLHYTEHALNETPLTRNKWFTHDSTSLAISLCVFVPGCKQWIKMPALEVNWQKQNRIHSNHASWQCTTFSQSIKLRTIICRLSLNIYLCSIAVCILKYLHDGNVSDLTEWHLAILNKFTCKCTQTWQVAMHLCLSSKNLVFRWTWE